MLLLKFNIIRLPLRIILCTENACHYHSKKIDTVAKRGSMLKDMIVNRDKRKNWHIDLVNTKAKVRVFEKIHKPHRRKAVLNSLFISNITDVLSTGDVAPDLMEYAIEITGVSISPCMQILNVFWQVPSNHYDSCTDIAKMLATTAPKIRAELISRNVLGRVPQIFFLRDATNERISEYENAVKRMEADPNFDKGIVADDSFTEDLYSFKDSKKSEAVKEKYPKLAEEKKTKDVPATPYKPTDMKNDVCGLNHAWLMDKVLTQKKMSKNPLQHTNIIFPETLKSTDDLFDKIPGVCLNIGKITETEDRDAILKKFRIERKMLKEKYKDKSDNIQYCNDDDDEIEEDFNYLENNKDFIDDETTDKTH